VREHRSGGGGRHAENECRRQNEERKAANSRRRRDPHKRGRIKADHHTEGHTKRPTEGRRGTHTGNTQTQSAEQVDMDVWSSMGYDYARFHLPYPFFR